MSKSNTIIISKEDLEKSPCAYAELLREDYPEDAIELYKKELENHPEHYDCFLKIALCYKQLGDEKKEEYFLNKLERSKQMFIFPNDHCNDDTPIMTGQIVFDDEGNMHMINDA